MAHRASHHPAIEAWQPEISSWLSAWGCPQLSSGLSFSVNPRLRASLGRCMPTRGEIRIAAFVLDASDDIVREVLCHEVAHAAAHALHGRRVKPHGVEWKRLMRAAGCEPRARFPAELLNDIPGWSQRRAPVVWEHRCPVCHAMRPAGRPVRSWRCGKCRGIGLSGRLEITRVEVGGARAGRGAALT